MIRRVRAKSSLGYPEVFHRFCGYLCDARRRARNFFSAAARALSSGRRLNFRRSRKKFRERGDEAGHAEDAPWVRLQPDSDVLFATAMLHSPCSGEISGENAVACAHQLSSPRRSAAGGL
jgi:hypothetical protein